MEFKTQFNLSIEEMFKKLKEFGAFGGLYYIDEWQCDEYSDDVIVYEIAEEPVHGIIYDEETDTYIFDVARNYVHSNELPRYFLNYKDAEDEFFERFKKGEIKSMAKDDEGELFGYNITEEEMKIEVAKIQKELGGVN